MQSMPQVHNTDETGSIQKPKNRPVATTSSITTYDADMRVWACCRSSSRSKAGRVPLVDVNLSRASRTRCAAARRLLTRGGNGGSARSWENSGFFAGGVFQQNQKPPPHTPHAFFVYIFSHTA